eukprot:86055_1
MYEFVFSPIASLILGSILTTFQITLAILLIHKLFFGLNKERSTPLSIAKAMQFSAIFALILESCAGVTGIIRIIYILSTHQIPYNAYISIYYSRLACNAFVYIALYFFLLCRMYHTFNDTYLAIKRCTIIIHIIVATLTIVLAFIMFTLALLGYGYETRIVFAATAVLPILAFIHLIYAFNARLFELVLTQRRTIQNDPDNIGLSEQQIYLLRIVRKHTLLGVLMMICAFVILVIYIYGVYVSRGRYTTLSTYDEQFTYYVLFDIFIVLSLNVASYGLYLGFSINQTQYKWFCGKCDHKCKILCENIAESKLKRDILCAASMASQMTSQSQITSSPSSS